MQTVTTLQVVPNIAGRLGLVSTLLAYRFVLDALFVWYLAPVWGYMGYSVEFDQLNFAVSLVQLGIIGLVLPTEFRRPSDLAICFYVALVILPFQTYSSYAGGSFAQMWASFIAGIPMFLVCVTPSVRFAGIRGGATILAVLAYGGIAVCMAYVIAKGGLAQFNLDPKKVYDFREAQKELFNLESLPI